MHFILDFIVKPVSAFLIAVFFCDINMGKLYDTVGMGIWHGLNVVANFILSIFTDRVVIAPIRTENYQIAFWITASISIIMLVGGIVYYLFFHNKKKIASED